MNLMKSTPAPVECCNLPSLSARAFPVFPLDETGWHPTIDRDMTKRIEDHITRTQAMVSRGRLRKYYRFRWARHYGGIATADCVGCCLRCLFCRPFNVICHPETTGTFFTPEQAKQH